MYIYMYNRQRDIQSERFVFSFCFLQINFSYYYKDGLLGSEVFCLKCGSSEGIS